MALFTGSPRVQRREIDLSNVLRAQGISNGGIVIKSIKGRINIPYNISDNKQFTEEFGNPQYTSGASTESGLTALGITSNADLAQIPDYGYGSYAALEFLKNSSSLYVVRSWDTNDKFSNAWFATDITTSAYTSAEKGNYTSVAPASSYSTFDTLNTIQALDNHNVLSGALNVYANSPSSEGNNIAITVEPFSPWSSWRYQYDPYPTNAIAASATNLTNLSASTFYPIAEKVFKINVYVKSTGSNWDDYTDKTGMVGYGMDSSLSATALVASATTSYRLTPIETFVGTLTTQKDVNNKELWIESVINGNSKYIYVKSNTSVPKFTGINDYNEIANKKDATGDFIYKNQFVALANGASSQSTGIGSITGWSGFENRELLNVNILINPDPSPAVKIEVGRVAAKRMDCIAINQVGTFKKVTKEDIKNSEIYGYLNPSYVYLVANYGKVYDSYTDKFVFLPNAIYVASQLAYVLSVGNPWDSIGGTNRGIIPVLDQNIILSTNDIGDLYDRNINCIKSVRGYGFAIWGQKTAQLKASALDRLNVRTLLIYIENNIETALNQFLFEPNTDKTRLRVSNLCDEFLRTILAGEGVEEYKVVCDETNNTAYYIDNNTLVVDLYIKPTKTIEYIQLTSVVANSSVSFNEVLLQR